MSQQDQVVLATTLAHQVSFARVAMQKVLNDAYLALDRCDSVVNRNALDHAQKAYSEIVTAVVLAKDNAAALASNVISAGHPGPQPV